MVKKVNPFIKKFIEEKERLAQQREEVRKTKDEYTTISYVEHEVDDEGNVISITFAKITHEKDSIGLPPDEFADFSVRLIVITAEGAKTYYVGKGSSRLYREEVQTPLLLGETTPESRQIIKKFGKLHMKHIVKGRYNFDERKRKVYKELLEKLKNK
jgi:hypothetical protein